jgi:hypothetical protein
MKRKSVCELDRGASIHSSAMDASATAGILKSLISAAKKRLSHFSASIRSRKSSDVDLDQSGSGATMVGSIRVPERDFA